ncbi:MAG TPA: hypothetical protein VK206_04370 [Anaerolineales bacterium]|nr:hypothetical protein [Anaerolineales bacterium]
MTTQGIPRISKPMKSTWSYYLLILLIIEKIIQHAVVTLAFYFNWTDITATVAISPIFLMISGAIIAVLFILSFWGMVRKQTWSINLVIALAVFDIIGEFIAQGKISIVITVSFVIATVLLILALMYRYSFPRTEQKVALSDKN